MQQFNAFLFSLGLMPREIVPGKWVRCATETHPRKRNGSYKLSDDGQVGWAIDFAAHAEPVMWRSTGSDLPVIDRAAIYKRKQQEWKDLQRATQGAREYYMACQPIRKGHEYLDRKGLALTGCSGLKVERKTGALVIPMMINGSLSSVQMIKPDGSKKFWPGAKTKGAVYFIERQAAPLTILCEGLSTGLTLYGAVPTARVVVAFSAGNLTSATDVISTGLCAVAADNDHETQKARGFNPGLLAAQNAAQALGCGYAIPNTTGSDWNDYAVERIALLMESERTQRRPKSIADLRRAVESEIRSSIMREAKLRV